MRSERESEKLEDEGSIPSRPTRGTKTVATRTSYKRFLSGTDTSRQYARVAELADAADFLGRRWATLEIFLPYFF